MLGGCRARLGGRTGPRAEKSRSGAGEADYRPCWGCVAKARGMWAGNPGRGLTGRVIRSDYLRPPGLRITVEVDYDSLFDNRGDQ